MKKNCTSLALWIIPIGFLSIFLFFPLLSILKLSFTRGGDGILPIFQEIFESQSLRRVLLFTIWQATLSTILTLLLGLPGAYLIARFKFPGKSLIRAMTGVPFVLPTLVVAASFNALLGQNGLINQLLMALFDLPNPPIEFIHTFSAIILAHIFYNTTIVLRMVGDFWSNLDPKLGKAAQSLGANRWQTLKTITLPLLAPVITAAALLVFIFDFTSFGVILILGGPRFSTLEVEIYYQTISLFNLPLAAGLSIIQIGCSLAMTWVYTRLSNRINRPLTKRARLHTQKPLNTWRNRILAIVILGILIITLLSPLVALASQSIYSLENRRDREGVVTRGFTLAYYKELFRNRQTSLFYVKPATSIGISMGNAAITVVFSLIVATPAAWALAMDSESLISKLLDPIIMLPLGTSAVTLGLGFIIAFAKPPLDLRSSPILLPIAHTLVAFPFVVRSLTPALRSINPRLRQAAAVLGASPREVLLEIDLPLIGRALLVAASFAFTISLGEFGATALISRPEYPTIPIVIYRLLGRPGGLNYGQALALSTIMMGITISGMLAIERFRIGEIGEF